MGSSHQIVTQQTRLRKIEICKMYLVAFFVFATLPYLASATITLACFSIPFTTLPSITLNGLNPILNTSAFSFATNVGDASTSVFDVCGWGVLTYVILAIIPSMIATHRLRTTARISQGPVILSSRLLLLMGPRWWTRPWPRRWG